MSEADDREVIQVDIPDDVLWRLMLAAHEHDITLNHMVERILREQLDRENEDGHGD